MLRPALHHHSPTHYPSSLKSHRLFFAVRKFYNKPACEQRPLCQLSPDTQSTASKALEALTMNTFDILTEGLQNLVVQPTMIRHLKIIPPFQGKFLFLNFGPLSEVYQEISAEKLKGNVPQPEQTLRKANVLKGEKENRNKFVKA